MVVANCGIVLASEIILPQSDLANLKSLSKICNLC